MYLFVFESEIIKFCLQSMNQKKVNKYNLFVILMIVFLV